MPDKITKKENKEWPVWPNRFKIIAETKKCLEDKNKEKFREKWKGTKWEGIVG